MAERYDEEKGRIVKDEEEAMKRGRRWIKKREN